MQGGRFLTEEDMKGSEHKLPHMSKFDTLLEVCRVASEKLQLEEKTSCVSDKTTLLSSMTCRVDKRTEATTSSSDDAHAKKKNSFQDSEHSVNKEKKPRPNRVAESTAPLPVEFAHEIQRLGGTNVRLLIQKRITATDLNAGENRFSIPYNQIREEAKDFLTEAEKEALERRGEDNRIVAMQVRVLEPNLEKSLISFKKWCVNKSFWYILCGSWTSMQVKNHLQADREIQVWSFRVEGELNLALVKIP